MATLRQLAITQMEAPGGVEPPTNGLGNRCSVHLSYGAIATQSHYPTSVYRSRIRTASDTWCPIGVRWRFRDVVFEFRHRIANIIASRLDIVRRCCAHVGMSQDALNHHIWSTETVHLPESKCGPSAVVHFSRYLWRQDMKASLFYRITAVRPPPYTADNPCYAATATCWKVERRQYRLIFAVAAEGQGMQW
jgi:hypothetical protein